MTTTTTTPEVEPLAIPSVDPLHLFRDGDLPPIVELASARLSVALEGVQFLAALLIQHGVDASSDGAHRLTACPDWTHGVGAALAAIAHSIQCAHCDLLGEAIKAKGGAA